MDGGWLFLTLQGRHAHGEHHPRSMVMHSQSGYFFILQQWLVLSRATVTRHCGCHCGLMDIFSRKLLHVVSWWLIKHYICSSRLSCTASCAFVQQHIVIYSHTLTREIDLEL